jgi:hypothetical protein
MGEGPELRMKGAVRGYTEKMGARINPKDFGNLPGAG